MITKTLYRVTRSDGGIDVTPNKPSHSDYTETYRLIADEGKILTDGNDTYTCIDTDEPSKYTEINESNEDFTNATESDYINALEEMGVDFNE